MIHFLSLTLGGDSVRCRELVNVGSRSRRLYFLVANPLNSLSYILKCQGLHSSDSSSTDVVTKEGSKKRHRTFSDRRGETEMCQKGIRTDTDLEEKKIQYYLTTGVNWN